MYGTLVYGCNVLSLLSVYLVSPKLGFFFPGMPSMGDSQSKGDNRLKSKIYQDFRRKQWKGLGVGDNINY